MSGIKRSWTVSGSMLIAAASGFSAAGEDTPVPARNATVSGKPSVAVPPAPSLTPRSPTSPQSSEQPAATVPPAADSQPPDAPFDSGTTIQDAQRYPLPDQPCPPGRFHRFIQHCRAKYLGFPEEFREPPLGSVAMGHELTQIAKGHAARMVLYQFDFTPASDELTIRGKAELARMARCMSTNCFPVVIESTPTNPELDELRRQAVWRELSANQVAIPFERVVVGRPYVRGLGAVDAMLVDRNRLNLTFSRGTIAGGGSSGASGGSAGTSVSSSTAGTVAR